MFQPTAEFIAKAKQVWGELYDYSETVYRGPLRPVVIGCRVHGEFKQLPYNHLKGHHCYACSAAARRMTTASFVERALAIFPQYDYSRVRYHLASTKVTIICPEHGPFERRPAELLSFKRGCPVCCRRPRPKRGPMYKGFASWQVELVREVLRERQNHPKAA